MSRFLSFVAAPLAVASLAFSAPLLHAQPAVPVAPAPDTPLPDAAQLAPLQRVEGTITLEQAGVTRTATLQFEPPFKLRITVAPDEASGSSGQTLVADGDTALLLSASTRRVLSYDFNPARRPWRESSLLGGGPANFALFGLSPDVANTDYSAGVQNGKVTLTARPGVGQQTTREDVRFGGTGSNAFYAAYKRASFNRPATIDLNVANGQVKSRIERDTEGQETGRAVFVYNGDLPREVTVQSPQGASIARYTYDLKVREVAFPAATFALDAPDGALVEAASPSPALLSGEGTSASDTYNRGIVRWRLTEDYRAAVTDWTAASQSQPNATAPLFALCDAALVARDSSQAGTALSSLRKLLGEGSIEVALRRAQLANLARDWAGAQAALRPALTAHPTSLPLLLSEVENAKARGDFDGAAQALRAITQVPNLAPNVYFSAAQALQHISDATNAATLLRGEALTRWKVREAERTGDFDGALALWKSLEASPTFGAEADAHEMAIYADKGSVSDSLQAWLALEVHSTVKADRDHARVALLNAWRKANRQSTLESVLTNRANAAAATEEDVRLWLNYQQINGNTKVALEAIQKGALKFPKRAAWQSLLSEALIATDPFGALDAVNKAIALEPQQSFYRVQKALILRGPATRGTPTNQQIAIFNNAVDAIARDFPDDPDAQLAVALARTQSLEDIVAAIPHIQSALTQGEVNDPSRHGFLLAARQGLASLYRQLDTAHKDPTAGQKAEAQYIMLMNASRSAIEEAAVASNYVVLIRSRKDANAAAKLLTTLADEPWSQSAWRSLVTADVRALAAEPELAQDTLTTLRGQNLAQANLAAAVLSGSLLELAQAIANDPKADDKAADSLRRAQAADQKSVAALDAPSPTPLLRGRAQALKGESIQATDAAAGAAAFAIAAQTEPSDTTTRLNFVRTLIASDQTEAAKAQRTAMFNALPEDYGRLQNAVAFALQFGENEAAKNLAYAVMNTAQLDPDATPADYENAALMAARAAFASGDTARGAALYTRLSDPQWAIEDRLAALLDWYDRGDADTQKRIADQVKALNPTEDQKATARSLSASLD